MLQHNGLPEYADPGENAVRAIAAGSDLLLYVLPADPSEFGISVDGLVGSIVAAVRVRAHHRAATRRRRRAGARRCVAALARANRMSDPGNRSAIHAFAYVWPTGRSDIEHWRTPQDDEHRHDDRDPRLPRRHLEGRHRPQRGRLQHPPPDDQQGEGQVRAIRRDLRDRREPPRLERDGVRRGRLDHHERAEPRRAPAHRRLLRGRDATRRSTSSPPACASRAATSRWTATSRSAASPSP